MLLESVDGRPHLEQARPVFKARKPLFIDKPVAGTLADAIAIFDLARETNTPCFSSSSLRFGPGVAAMRQNAKVGDVIGCDVYGPCPLEEHHPDLFWYGDPWRRDAFHDHGHRAASRFRARRPRAPSWLSGVWNDGRVGTFRGMRKGPYKYGGTVFGTKGNVPIGDYGGYEPLVVEIVKFFKTGKPPVSADETIEIFAFMEAADESKRQGGKPVTHRERDGQGQEPDSPSRYLPATSDRTHPAWIPLDERIARTAECADRPMTQRLRSISASGRRGCATSCWRSWRR